MIHIGPVMLYLSRKKLASLLSRKGLSLSGLAKAAGISRQNLYRYFRGETVFTIPFQKILRALSVPYQEITEEQSEAGSVLSKAPFTVQKAVRMVIEFAEKEGAGVILFGSRARGQEGLARDWDFGLRFRRHNPGTERRFKLLRQKVVETAFPHRIDLVNLNRAPRWFLASAVRPFISLHGAVSEQELLQGEAA